jgi:DNA modification methylase
MSSDVSTSNAAERGYGIPGLRIQIRSVNSLAPYDRNARTHSDEQISQIARSIGQFGWTNPILAGPDNVVIAGHARLAAAKQLGVAEVPVIVLGGLTEQQRRALVLADNQLASNAGWDEEILRAELMRLQAESYDLETIGFSDEQLQELLVQAEPVVGNTDEDAVPDQPEVAVSAPGDVWRLGQHRLVCGDSTDREAVSKLMCGNLADLVFTDPPYNVAYEGYTEDRLTIAGDRMSPQDFIRFLQGAFANCRGAVKPGASLYVCHSSSWQREFQNALEAAGFEVRCQIVWAKNTFAWGFGRYKFQHEPIFYAHVSGQSDAWYGDRSQSTLWQENKPVANRLHPTMKPVELIERALANSSKAGDLVLDLFGGSGSTLIACERQQRLARMVELDAKYCDVIIKRWQDFTGCEARLESNGRTLAEVQQIRMSMN